MINATSALIGDEPGQAILVSLFSTIHEGRAATAAQRLLAAFGSLPGVLAARPEAQAQVLDGEPKLIRCLAALRAAMLHAMVAEVRAEPVIATSESLLRYLDATMAYEPREHVRVLFLNAANRLIGDEVVTSGSVQSAELYPREIMRRALEIGATAIILVHNHPSGNPAASAADIRGTRVVVEAGRTLGIIVHDHIVVARDGYTSFRQEGLL